MYDPREILKRSIEGKHAVQDVADIAGHPKEEENAETLMESLQHKPYGDLVVAPDDYWSVEDSLADIRRFQGTGE
jgi:hypothetical protein